LKLVYAPQIAFQKIHRRTENLRCISVKTFFARNNENPLRVRARARVWSRRHTLKFVLRTIFAFQRLSSIYFPERASEGYLLAIPAFRNYLVRKNGAERPTEQISADRPYALPLTVAGLRHNPSEGLVEEQISTGVVSVPFSVFGGASRAHKCLALVGAAETPL
jgi:hypothetical protein